MAGSLSNVEPLEDLRIRATFSDGAVKEVDLSALFGEGGVFVPIRDRREIFEQVRVSASGARLERRTIRGAAQAAN